MKLLELIPSPNPDKKYMAVFDLGDGRTKTTHFGAKPYQDYTQHHSKLRRMLYLTRHRFSENWNDPTSAGALSRWILWGPSTSFNKNVEIFKKKFNL